MWKVGRLEGCEANLFDVMRSNWLSLTRTSRLGLFGATGFNILGFESLQS